MLRRSLTRYIQRDINNVVNRQTMAREPGDPKRYLSFGLRVNNRQEIEVTYRGTDDNSNPWGSEVDYLGTVDLDENIITGLDADNYDFRNKVERFLTDLEQQTPGIDVLNETDEPPRKVDTTDTDLNIE